MICDWNLEGVRHETARIVREERAEAETLIASRGYALRWDGPRRGVRVYATLEAWDRGRGMPLATWEQQQGRSDGRPS